MIFKCKRRFGFTVVEVVIVVSIIGLLALMAIPNFASARSTSRRRMCINNLRQIDSAKHEWALELGKTLSSPAPDPAELQPYLGRGATGSVVQVVCPNDRGGTIESSYALGSLGTVPVCKVTGAAQESDMTKAHILEK